MILAAGLPAHTHKLFIMQETGTGAPPSNVRFITSNGTSATLAESYMDSRNFAGDIDNSIYGNADTVQPSALQMILQIKY